MMTTDADRLAREQQAAESMALKLSSMMTERDPEHRNRRPETVILDEHQIIAWGLCEFARQQFAAERQARETLEQFAEECLEDSKSYMASSRGGQAMQAIGYRSAMAHCASRLRALLRGAGEGT